MPAPVMTSVMPRAMVAAMLAGIMMLRTRLP